MAVECHPHYIDRCLAEHGCAEHTGESFRKNVDFALVQPLGLRVKGRGQPSSARGHVPFNGSSTAATQLAATAV